MAMKNPKLIWIDQITGQPNKTADFYTALLGYKQVPCDEGDGYTSYSLADDLDERFGIVEEAVFPDWPYGWVLYFEVDDFDSHLDMITSMGGEILRRSKRQCVLKDPSGAPVVIRSRVDAAE